MKHALALCRLPNSDQIFSFGGVTQAKPNTYPYFVVKPWGNDEILYFTPKGDSAPSPTQPIQANTTFATYESIFNAYHDAFESGSIQKTILSKIKHVDLTSELDQNACFERLNAIRNDSFNYLLLHPSLGSWVGASPEILLEKRGDQLKTVSLAGTQKNLKVHMNGDQRNVKNKIW